MATEQSQHKIVCPFCRAIQLDAHEERNKLTWNRCTEFNDAEAWNDVAVSHYEGSNGFPVDRTKAMELMMRAGELGCSSAYANIGNAYFGIEGYEYPDLDKDKQKALHFWQLAAMKGDARSRHNLGGLDLEAGNVNRAMKHFMVAVRAGYDISLSMVQQGFTKGDVTKDDYESTLRAYQNSRDEAKSEQRDKAIAFRTRYPNGMPRP